MAIFNPNINNSINNNGGVQQTNYPKVEQSRITEFGTIDPSDNQIIQFNLSSQPTDKKDNNITNIRTTLTGFAIRNDKFNYYTGKFDNNFPGNDVYSFCNPELGVIFNNSGHQYTRKFSKTNQYPSNITIQKVKDSVQNNQYGNNYTGSCVGCPGNIPPDPITGKCVSSTQKCIPDPVTPCPEPELINLKPTIYGYAYYLDTIREVDVPNIGSRLVRCAGGHVCNRTHFRPKLKLNDDSIVESSNNISLDNLTGLTTPGYDIASYFPVPGFNSTTISVYERSDSFTFTVNPSLLDNTCEIYLECLSDVACHPGVTMIFLVGQRSDNDEYVLIFADCVAPGTVNAEFLGSVPCNNDPPINCEDITPPPPCNYLEKTSTSITFSNVNIPLEATNDQDIIDKLEALINNAPHVLSFATVDEFGFAIDPNPYTIGTVNDTIQVLLFFTGATDGFGNISITITINILQTASAYPFMYSVSFSDSIPENNVCNFMQTSGQVPISNGISGPLNSGDGNESVSIVFV